MLEVYGLSRELSARAEELTPSVHFSQEGELLRVHARMWYLQLVLSCPYYRRYVYMDQCGARGTT